MTASEDEAATTPAWRGWANVPPLIAALAAAASAAFNGARLILGGEWVDGVFLMGLTGSLAMFAAAFGARWRDSRGLLE